jgi:SNF2 family DNA or RNA helicase
VQLRRRRRDVLRDLPEKLVVDVPIELAPAQREAYERAENEGIVALSQAGSAATVTSVLELIVRLKQLCNRDPVSGESAKFADIRERLAALRAEGHRALVFSQFTDAMFGVDAVAGALRAYRPLRYTGDMTPGARVGTVERFVGYPEHGALLLSLRAGGVGLNLQAASYVFHLDRWWNPASEEQAESRAHRMGQPLPVTVYRYTCTDTIEERIAEKLAEKRALFHRVVDDVSLDLAHALSEADLFGLFGLDAPRTRS